MKSLEFRDCTLSPKPRVAPDPGTIRSCRDFAQVCQQQQASSFVIKPGQSAQSRTTYTDEVDDDDDDDDVFEGLGFRVMMLMMMIMMTTAMR